MTDDAERTVARSELTNLLASALGQEKGEEVVVAAARALGLAGPHFAPDEVRAIFARLSTEEGLIGVVARFVVSRGDVEALVERTSLPSARRASSAKLQAAKPGVAVVDLLPLLAPALGTEKARDATNAAAVRLGLDARSLTRDDAVAVLDELARAEGIVGVVARFAKARFLLEK